MSTSGIIEDDGDCPTDGRNTKKVQFKDNGVDTIEMPVDVMSASTVSWKDLLLRNSRIEYESLLSICFSCGQYDHVKELCSFSCSDKEVAEVGEGLKEANSIVSVLAEDTIEFVPWLVVERCPSQNPKESRKSAVKILVSVEEGSKFNVVFSGVNEKGERKDLEDDFLGIQFKKGLSLN
ncbi:hypothetical protein Gotur_003895 [Gossypium turneri]